MEPFEKRFGGRSAGRILDVATSGGGFLKLLIDTFSSYDEAIGIDTSSVRLKEAATNLPGERLHFLRMDAACLDFDDDAFDTVAMRHSMHHMEDPGLVLEEMMRVLKPGGHLILDEVLGDRATERPESQRHLHHWWAAVDRTQGIPHFDTLTTDQILEYVNRLDLHDLEVMDFYEAPSESESKKATAEMVATIDPYIAKLKGNSDHQDLIRRGEQLKELFSENECAWERELLVFGRKK